MSRVYIVGAGLFLVLFGSAMGWLGWQDHLATQRCHALGGQTYDSERVAIADPAAPTDAAGFEAFAEANRAMVLGMLLTRMVTEYDKRHDEVMLIRPGRAESTVVTYPRLTIELNEFAITMQEWDVLAPILGMTP